MSQIPEPERCILDEVEARIIAAELAKQSQEVRHGDDELVVVLSRTVGRLEHRRAVDRNAAGSTEGEPQ